MLSTATDSFQNNMKFTLIFDNLYGLEENIKTYIKTTIIPYVQTYFQKVMRVHSTRSYDFTGTTSCSDVPVPPEYQRILSTDYVMLITTMNTTSQPDMKGGAATCSYCVQSFTNKRPIMGVTTINTDVFKKYSVTSTADFEFMALVLIHEILHGLGWSDTAFDSYQDLSLSTTSKTIGLSGVVETTMRRGKKVKQIILPNVVATAREYFGCSSITGVELEDEGGSGTSGSHWERRIVPEDLMIGTINNLNGLSNFTMSLLEGTGWYKMTRRSYAHNI